MIPLSFTLNSLKDKIYYWKLGIRTTYFGKIDFFTDVWSILPKQSDIGIEKYLFWLVKKIVTFWDILFGVQLNILILTKNLISRLAVQTRCWRIDVMEEKVVCPVRICSLLPSQSWWYCTLGFDSSAFIQNKSRHVNFDYLHTNYTVRNK